MGYSQEEAKAFINRIAPIIREEGTRRGYPIVSTIIAQSIIEGAAGTSTLAKKPNYNHFGMKAGKNWTGKVVRLRTKEEYVKGQLTTIYADFRVYDNDFECIKGYFDFISTKRYANLKTAHNYREYAERLSEDGYATSKTYVDTLCKTVEKYRLEAYDRPTKADYFKKYTGDTVSIAVALESIGENASYPYRKKIYLANFGDGYKGTDKQNTAMLDKLKRGILIKPE